jgi:aminoglycoside phosphotransferase (APT) family kinase protein
MARLRVTGVPDGVPEDLVLRVVPDPAMGAKELAVQAAAHDAGIHTPQVHLTGDSGGPLGGAWAVMDLAPGSPMLAGLDGLAAIRRLPALLRHLPGQLAETMTAIHRVDPGPVARRVRFAAATAALGVEELWAHLHDAAIDVPRVRAALERLHDNKPLERETVLCHGDLHPLNLLSDAKGDVTVLDWTAAAIAPPEYDVAFTWLLIGNPPLEAPGPIRPVINSAAGLLARRFLQRYRRANGNAALTDLPWYAALHGTRVLVDLAMWRGTNDTRAVTHPWRLVAPGAARAVRRVTGIDVEWSGAAAVERY